MSSSIDMGELLKEVDGIVGEAMKRKGFADTFSMAEVRLQVLTAYLTYKAQDNTVKELRS